MKIISDVEKRKNNERAKRWYAKNKERKLAYDKVRRKSNPNRFSKERQLHYELYKTKEQATQRIYNLKPETRYKRAIKNANKRKKEWNITKEQYITLISQPCFYDGKSLSTEFGVGLDRIDNSKGYSFDNVVPCCGDCNITRGDRFTSEEMKIAMQAVLDFRRKNE